ncbi:hypothetical protein [Tabrizicola sp.]|uniref:hypothetical protein n=1 Tax=Tabrizicola sp. TaxID=2005166 RepID=UPI0035B32495
MIRIALALALSATAAQAEGSVALPSGFDGVYATEGLGCDDLGRVEVGGGVMVGAEFAITVTDLIEFPGEPNKVEATLLNEGGGGSWTDSAVITLAEDELRFEYPDGSVATWTRCD